MEPFVALTVLGALALVLAARLVRGRLYARFATMLLTIQAAATIPLFPHVEALGPAATGLFCYGQLAVMVHLGSLLAPRLRSLPWRLLVSWPGAMFSAGSFLALPWALAAGVGLTPHLWWAPYALALFGLLESLTARRGEVHLDLGADRPHAGEAVARHRPPPHSPAERPLRVVQLTDPHLGPFMSEARLARICRRAVEARPDLIVLTGDLLTMESQADVAAATRAFAPLAALPGRVFACMGNHDYEAPETVVRALGAAGVRLLCDEEATVETEAGPVQLLGMEYTWRERAQHLLGVTARFPRRTGHLRVVLLHDPGAFKHLPAGEADLVLSGHTHGGQLGLVTLGLPWTFLTPFPSLPDHGLWARGQERLYVHRGTGHYGFPLRLGVPAEESVLVLHR